MSRLKSQKKPPVPRELLLWLKERFPDRAPDRKDSDREVWIKGGRIAAVKPAGTFRRTKASTTRFYDARGGIVAAPVSSGRISCERFKNQMWSSLVTYKSTTCCMLHLFGSGPGQKGSTL